MLAKVTLKCWPTYAIFLGAEDGQHFYFKNAWFCRENKIFERKQAPNLASILTLNIWIYIYMHAVE